MRCLIDGGHAVVGRRETPSERSAGGWIKMRKRWEEEIGAARNEQTDDESDVAPEQALGALEAGTRTRQLTNARRRFTNRHQMACYFHMRLNSAQSRSSNACPVLHINKQETCRWLLSLDSVGAIW